MRSLDLSTLMQIVEEMAKNEADGHVSMLKFTTGWKVFFGTPTFETLTKALQDLIINKTKRISLFLKI